MIDFKFIQKKISLSLIKNIFEVLKYEHTDE